MFSMSVCLTIINWISNTLFALSGATISKERKHLIMPTLLNRKTSWQCHGSWNGQNLTRPGIEPGSKQPQCFILTTIRSSPATNDDITLYNLHIHALQSSILALSLKNTNIIMYCAHHQNATKSLWICTFYFPFTLQ